MNDKNRGGGSCLYLYSSEDVDNSKFHRREKILGKQLQAVI